MHHKTITERNSRSNKDSEPETVLILIVNVEIENRKWQDNQSNNQHEEGKTQNHNGQANNTRVKLIMWFILKGYIYGGRQARDFTT